MEPLPFKLMALGVILVLALVCSLLPLKVRASPRVLSAANMLGGGVFLATGLIHLLGEAAEGMEELHAFNHFPMAFAFCGIGFIAALSMEELAMYIVHRVQAGRSVAPACGDARDSPSASNPSMINGITDVCQTQLNLARLEGPSGGDRAPVEVPELPHEAVAGLSAPQLARLRAHYAEFARAVAARQEDGAERSPANVMCMQQTLLTSDLEQNAGIHDCSRHDVVSSSGRAHGVDHSGAVAVHGHAHAHSGDGDHGHSHGGLVETTQEGSIVSAVVLWFALSFHCIMAGIALGASEEAATSIFAAIVAHKGLEAFSFGSNVSRTHCSLGKYLAFIIAFSLTTPLGILIGLAIEEEADGLGTFSIMSVASGTFLYVAIVEVILHEVRIKKDQLLKLVLLCAGFGFMALLAKWT